MRYEPISSDLFTANRARLAKLLPPNSLAVVNANDIPPTNADGTMAGWPNADLFYLTGIEQEQKLTPHRLLRNVTLFESLSDEQIGELAATLKHHVLGPDETLFREGDTGTALYIIAAGVLEISRGTLYRKIVEYSLEPETRTSRNRTTE